MRPLARASRLLVLLALAPTVGAGCSLASTPPDDPFGGPGGEGVRIEVRNRNIEDALVLALRGDIRQRLGVVAGLSSSSFTIEWPEGLPLRFEIDLTVGPSCVTRSLQVEPGDVVRLEIESDLLADPECTPTGRRGGRSLTPGTKSTPPVPPSDP